MARNLGAHHLPTAPVAQVGEPRQRDRLTGVALMLLGGTSSQFGASFGAMIFPVIGPVGVVAVRQWVAALVLGGIARPRFWRFAKAQWRPVVALAVTFATMNLCVYLAIDRIGLGLTITLEFLGPLAIAVFGAKRLVNVLCAIAAGIAVVVLTRPGASTDYVGVGLACLAAVCWALYIFANRAVGQRLPGVQGSATAAMISALAYLPIGVWILANAELTGQVIAYALLAGLLSSGVPYFVDVLALRRVPTHMFGVFMSVHPIIAAIVGWLMLGERLDLASWLAIVVIVAANATVLMTQSARGVRRAVSPSLDRRSRARRRRTPAERSAR
jgi:inner membrane transporter RhtA